MGIVCPSVKDIAPLRDSGPKFASKLVLPLRDDQLGSCIKIGFRKSEIHQTRLESNHMEQHERGHEEGLI